MNDKIDISILIPTYRRTHLLGTLLERCAAQTGTGDLRIEMIVVDNCPEESARSLVEGMRLAIPTRYVCEPASGISHVRNRCFAYASGWLVALIDDDELPEPDWLANLVATQQRYRADVVFGPVHPIFAKRPRRFAALLAAYLTQTSDLPTGTPVHPRSRLASLWHGKFCRRTMASNNALLVRDRCIETAQPFHPGLGLTGGEDTLFFLDLYYRGRKMVWCREAPVGEVVHPDRLNLRYLALRQFRTGQSTCLTRAMLSRPRLAEIAFLMLTATMQTVLFSLAAVIYLPFSRERAAGQALKLCSAVGKLFWMNTFRMKAYGQKHASFKDLEAAGTTDSAAAHPPTA